MGENKRFFGKIFGKRNKEENQQEQSNQQIDREELDRRYKEAMKRSEEELNRQREETLRDLARMQKRMDDLNNLPGQRAMNDAVRRDGQKLLNEFAIIKFEEQYKDIVDLMKAIEHNDIIEEMGIKRDESKIPEIMKKYSLLKKEYFKEDDQKCFLLPYLLEKEANGILSPAEDTKLKEIKSFFNNKGGIKFFISRALIYYHSLGINISSPQFSQAKRQSGMVGLMDFEIKDSGDEIARKLGFIQQPEKEENSVKEEVAEDKVEKPAEETVIENTYNQIKKENEEIKPGDELINTLKQEYDEHQNELSQEFEEKYKETIDLAKAIRSRRWIESQGQTYDASRAPEIMQKYLKLEKSQTMTAKQKKFILLPYLIERAKTIGLSSKEDITEFNQIHPLLESEEDFSRNANDLMCIYAALGLFNKVDAENHKFYRAIHLGNNRISEDEILTRGTKIAKEVGLSNDTINRTDSHDDEER